MKASDRMRVRAGTNSAEMVEDHGDIGTLQGSWREGGTVYIIVRMDDGATISGAEASDWEKIGDAEPG